MTLKTNKLVNRRQSSFFPTTSLLLMSVAFAFGLPSVFGLTEIGAVAAQEKSDSDTSASKEGAEGESKEGEKAEEEKEDNEKIFPGVVASFGTAPKSAGVEYAGTKKGKVTSPLSVSITKSGRDKCQVQVGNNSKEHSYSASFSASGQTKSGAKVRGRAFSVRLKPGGKSTKEFSCAGAVGMQVKVKSGRRV